MSQADLFENGEHLIFRNSDIWKIGRFGRGRFTFFEGKLYFSASDNSSIFKNNREYILKVSDKQIHVNEKIIYPSDVGIEITNVCNAKCVYCPLYQSNENALKYPKGYMDMELFKKIIDEIAYWPTWFSIYLNNGGEPLLDKYFEERVTYLKEKGLSERVILQTNAQFLTKEKAKLLLDAGIGHIFPAFDGAIAATYEKHRVNCNYEVVLNNIRNFARMRDEGDYATSIQIKFMRTKWNEKELVDTYYLFNDFLSPELDHFQEEYSHTWNESYLKKKGFALTEINTNKLIRECRMANSYFPIYRNGDVGACSLDYNHEVIGKPLGNVKNELLLDIWKGKEFAKIRSAMKRLSKMPSKNHFYQCICGLPHKCRDCYLMYYEEGNIDNLLPENRLFCKAAFSSYIYRFMR